MIPPNNTALRGLLKAIRLAYEAKNADLLAALADAATVSVGDIVIYTTYLREELLDEEYRVYTEDAGTAAKERLERKAYGNFVEAAVLLAEDAYEDPLGKDPKGPDYSKFRPEFFSPEDRKFWNEAQKTLTSDRLKSYENTSPESMRRAAIRTHLQKYLGELRTIYRVHYIDTASGSGVSVQILFNEATTKIDGGNQDLRKKLQDLNLRSIDQLPVHISGFSLQSTDSTRLFDYEIKDGIH